MYSERGAELFRNVFASRYPFSSFHRYDEIKNPDGSIEFDVRGISGMEAFELKERFNQEKIKARKTEEERLTAERAERAKRDTVALSYNSKGIESSKRGDVEGAIWYFNEALKVGPSQNIEAQLWGNVGIMLEVSNHDEVKRLEMAFEVYDKALSVDPRRADLLQKREHAHRKAEQIRKNRAFASQIASIDCSDPFDHASFNERGRLKLENGDLDGALKDFKTAKMACLSLTQKECKEFEQQNTSIWGRKWDSIHEFMTRSTLNMHRSMAPYAFNCGVVHERKGNWEEAIKHYEHALMLSPQFDVEESLSRVEAKRGKDPVYIAKMQRTAERERLEEESRQQKEMLRDAVREALVDEFRDLRHEVRCVGVKIEGVGDRIESSLRSPEIGSINFYTLNGYLGTAKWTRRRV